MSSPLSDMLRDLQSVDHGAIKHKMTHSSDNSPSAGSNAIEVVDETGIGVMCEDWDNGLGTEDGDVVYNTMSQFNQASSIIQSH